MEKAQSTDPWLCEVPWHSHTGPERGRTCRPDSIRHPEPERDEQ